MSQRPAADKPAKPVATAGWTFFRQWLKNPLSIAALSPSGRQLAGRMMHELPSGAKRVVELGGGTGVFTRAMLEHGIEPHNLMVVELNEELYQYLHASFPEVNVVWGNACDLNAALREARAQDAPYRVALLDARMPGTQIGPVVDATRLAERAGIEGTHDRISSYTHGSGYRNVSWRNDADCRPCFHCAFDHR